MRYVAHFFEDRRLAEWPLIACFPVGAGPSAGTRIYMLMLLVKLCRKSRPMCCFLTSRKRSHPDSMRRTIAWDRFGAATHVRSARNVTSSAACIVLLTEQEVHGQRPTPTR